MATPRLTKPGLEQVNGCEELGSARTGGAATLSGMITSNLALLMHISSCISVHLFRRDIANSMAQP